MEERSQDELEKLFQSNLNDLEVSPSEKVWKDIEKRLDKKRRRRFFWIFFLGILLTGGGGYGLYKSEIFKGDDGITINNNSGKDDQLKTKNAEVKNGQSSESYNKTDVEKKNNQTDNDVDPITSGSDKTSMPDNRDPYSKQDPDGDKSGVYNKKDKENKNNQTANNIDPAKSGPDKTFAGNNRNSYLKQDPDPGISLSQKNNQQPDKKKKAVADTSGLNKQTASGKENFSPNKPIDNVKAGNSNRPNPVNGPGISSEASAKKINNTEQIISGNQNDEAAKNKSMNPDQHTDQPLNHDEKSINKDQEINNAEPDRRMSSRKATKMNEKEGTQPGEKDTLNLNGKRPALAADTAISNFDSVMADKENSAVLKKDSIIEKKKEKKISKFSVAAFYSPDMNKPFVTDRALNNFNDPYHYKNISHPQNSFSAGLVMGYDQTDRLRWQTGIFYTELTQSTDASNFKYNWHDKLSFDFTNSFGSLQLNSTQFDKSDNSSGYPSDTIHIKYDTKESLSYIKLPFTFNYKLIKGRFSVYTIASITGIALVKNQMEFHVLNASSGKVISAEMSGIRKINIGFMGGLGGQINLFRGLYIFAEPNLKTSLLAINRRTGVKYIPFSLSVSAGLGFHF
jgi:hypothetical protein